MVFYPCFISYLGSCALIGQFNKAKAAASSENHGADFFRPKLKFTLSGAALFSLKKSLQNKGFRLEEQSSEEGLLLDFRKNRLGAWGSFVFHAGLLLLVLASLLNFAFQKWGFVQLIEGDAFSGREEDFLTSEKGMFAGGFNVNAEVYLASFRHAYWDTGELKELASEVVIRPPEAPSRKAVITKASPLFIKGVRVYQSGYFGYAVKLDLVKDNRIMPGYFLLDMAPMGKPLTGKSDFPTTGYDLDMTFYPDKRGASIYPADPVLAVRFLRGEKELARKILRLGDEAVVEGKRFRFAEVRNWSGLIFSENRFMPLIYMGFFVISCGPALAFIFPFQKIIIDVSPQAQGGYTVKAAVRSRIGREQLLNDLMSVINDEINAPMDKT